MESQTNDTVRKACIVFFIAALLTIPVIEKAHAAPEVKSLPTLIDVGRGTCTPCKMMKPILEGLKKEYAGVLDVKMIDVRDDPGALQRFKIRGVPFQFIFDVSGKELARHYGIMDKQEILKWLKSVGIDVQKEKALITGIR